MAENREIGTSPWTVEEPIAAAERIIASDPMLFTNPESESNKELNVRSEIMSFGNSSLVLSALAAKRVLV